MGYCAVEMPAAATGSCGLYAQRICPPWDPQCSTRVCLPYCTPCYQGRPWSPLWCVDIGCQTHAVCSGTLPCLCDCYCRTGRFAPPNDSACTAPDDPNCVHNCHCSCFGKPCPAPGCNCSIN